MPKRVFLSYSQKDEPIVAKISTILKSKGVDVWRDKESVNPGKLFPEEIAKGLKKADAVVFFFSENTESSHWVPFELNSALALRKLIIPVLIGNQPLPEILASIQALRHKKPEATAAALFTLLDGQRPTEVFNDLDTIAEKIAAIPPDTPEKVTETLRDLIRQQNWNVTGNITQNFTININSGNNQKGSEAKRWYGRWQIYVALGVGVVTILLGLRELLKKPSAPPPPAHCSLRGNIVGGEDQPVGNLEVRVNDDPKMSMITPSAGGFYFDSVPGDCGRDDVQLYIYRDGIKIWDELIVVPGPHKVKIDSL